MTPLNRIVIIEDERIAAANLQRLLKAELPQMQLEAVLASIEESVEYFSSHESPDLIFADIHLADGLAFDIFNSVAINCPVIFTTAYEQYALNAFKVNTVDYLLKPINPADLHHAINKLEKILMPSDLAPKTTEQKPLSPDSAPQYKSHFLIPANNRLIPLEVRQIACLYLEDRITRAILFDGRQQIMDGPLDSIMAQLNPDIFFRANRQYIIAHNAIREISIWPISKLAVSLSVATPSRIIVPKARVREFKEWYTK